MPRIIELKAIGETITFTKPTHETGGAFLEVVITFPNKAAGPVFHLHPLQTKYFEALEGQLAIDLGKDKIILDPGQSYLVPEGTIHTCYPNLDKPIKFKVTYTPALSFEYMVTEMFEACNRNNSRSATPFEACYIMTQGKGEYFIAKYPVFFQRIAFFSIGLLGKLFGLVKVKPKSTYY